MFRLWSLALLMALSFSAQSQQLEKLDFTDQWDKQQTLNTQTQLLIFSTNKQGSEWVKSSLEAVQVTDLNAQGWLYVADISGMPGFISKMFAIPKMKDYPFAIALDREGDVTASWPRTEQGLSVFELESLEVVKQHRFQSPESLQVFLQSKL
jgi:hypothetical protein